MSIYDAARPIYLLCKISGLAVFRFEKGKYVAKKADTIFALFVAVVVFSAFVLLWARTNYAKVTTGRISEHILRGVVTLEFVTLVLFSFYYKNTIIECFAQIYDADLRFAEMGLEIAHSKAKKELIRNLGVTYLVMLTFIILDVLLVVSRPHYDLVMCVVYDLGGLIATHHLCLSGFLLNEFRRRFFIINSFLENAQEGDLGTVFKLRDVYKALCRFTKTLNTIFEEQMLCKIFGCSVITQTTVFLLSLDVSKGLTLIELSCFWLIVFTAMHVLEVLGALYYYHNLQTEVSP